MTPEELLKEQIKLEEEIRKVTIDRYYADHTKAAERGVYGDTHVGRNLINSFIDVFIANVTKWKLDKLNGGAGRRPRAAKMLEEFDDDAAACYIFIKHMLNTIHNTSARRYNKGKSHAAPRTTVCIEAAAAIHEEYRLRYFRTNFRALAKKIIKDHDTRDLPKDRRKELWRREFNKQKIDWQAQGWGIKERMNLGLVLLDLFTTSTGLVEEFVSYEADKALTTMVQVAPHYAEQIAQQMARSAEMFTVFYPTVLPPVPWKNGSLRGGGYFTDNIHPYPLVKRAHSKFLSELENRDMSSIITAVNALQETPWRVNMEIVEAVKFAYENDLGVAGIPLSNPEENPPVPSWYKQEGYEQETKDYQYQCYMVRDRNRRAISKRLAVMRTIGLASRFSKYPAIYFPHDLDSRGRAYPKPAFLNPQGPDYSKSMLEFSEGRLIETPEHEAYLAIAIANAWGQDKLPLQERVDWVEDNEQMLLEIAADWRNDLRWTHADEPFMALRGALEWYGLCASAGQGFVSHMPVHFDATCSGLQHFSAILRDAEGGFHVNLTSCEDRQDIYGAVAAKAKASIEALLDDHEYGTVARIALDIGITRGLCKRPVMIVPYSGTFKAAMRYIEEYIKDAGVPIPLDEQTITRSLVPFITHHVWSAIGNTVIAAREAMDWITHAARLASTRQKAPIQWETPDGFVCRQAIFEEKEFTVETVLDGRGRIQTRLKADKATLDPRQMAQSLSPNYIHSMDACHLRKAVLKGLDIGITNFAMIHDSFGVHASEMPRFVEECIKPAFIEMYEDGKTLEKFRAELMVNIREPEKLRELPAMGDLSLEEVQASQFFFS